MFCVGTCLGQVFLTWLTMRAPPIIMSNYKSWNPDTLTISDLSNLHFPQRFKSPTRYAILDQFPRVLGHLSKHRRQDHAVGYKEYREALGVNVTEEQVYYLPVTPVLYSFCLAEFWLLQNRRLRWKIDLIILPIFMITQGLQFLDKTALNYANLFGYQEALGLDGQQFNYLSASMFSCPWLNLLSSTDRKSGVLWLFLWPVPMWLAHWSVSGSKSARGELLVLGAFGHYPDPMPKLWQCM